MIRRGTSTSGIPLPVWAESVSLQPVVPPTCPSTESRPPRRRGRLRRPIAMQLSEDVAAITGSDEVIAFCGDELWTPIAGKDDVIFCDKNNNIAQSILRTGCITGWRTRGSRYIIPVLAHTIPESVLVQNRVSQNQYFIPTHELHLPGQSVNQSKIFRVVQVIRITSGTTVGE